MYSCYISTVVLARKKKITEEVLNRDFRFGKVYYSVCKKINIEKYYLIFFWAHLYRREWSLTALHTVTL